MFLELFIPKGFIAFDALFFPDRRKPFLGATEDIESQPNRFECHYYKQRNADNGVGKSERFDGEWNGDQKQQLHSPPDTDDSFSSSDEATLFIEHYLFLFETRHAMDVIRYPKRRIDVILVWAVAMRAKGIPIALEIRFDWRSVQLIRSKIYISPN